MERYTSTARWYDLIAAEQVYRAGRLAALGDLDLRPGTRVLDLGCGTGLNLPGLVQAVGVSGQVVGVDAAPRMLEVAAGKARAAGWSQVRLVRADATTLDADDLAEEGDPGSGAGFDAVLVTYALSVTPDPGAAWRAVRALLRPGARVGVVDLQPPTGRARLLAPLARLACAAGGSDIEARPWREVEVDLVDVRARSLRGGHVQVRVGSWGGAR